MKDAPPPPGTGHTLGSGGSVGSGGSLSPDEVRARRLAALSGGGGGGGYAAPAAAAAAAASAFTSPGEGSHHHHQRQRQEGEGKLKDPPPRHVSFGGTVPGGEGGVQHVIGTASSSVPSVAQSSYGTAGGDDGGATAMDIDSDDAELQRALALSLMGGDGAAAGGGDMNGGIMMKRSVAGRPPTPSPADDRKPAALLDHDSKPAAATRSTRVVASSSSTSDEAGAAAAAAAQQDAPPRMENMVIQMDKRCGVPQSHLAAFHSIMWNDSVTTEGDRERWRGQGIDTTPSIWDYDETEASTTTVDSSSIGSLTASTAASSTTSADAAHSPLDDKNVSDAIASALGSHHSLWGLTQVHGGPCGVLAAVQAEMLRMILFGRADKGSSDSSGSTASDGHCDGLQGVQYPRAATDGMADVAPTRTEVQESLALAVGTILARASLVPLASVKEREAEEESKKEGWVKVAKNKNGEEEKSRDNAETEEEGRGVRIVLPAEAIIDSDQGSDAMDDDDDDARGGSSHIYDGLTWEMLDSSSGGDALCICSINITPETAEEEEEEGTGPESKRQRKNSVAGSTVVSCEATSDGHISCLATIIAKFLLDKNNSAKKDPLLQYFAGQGGVLLLVLSLLESRGVDRTKSDMDDSSSTLTSQFGHSSQELINLLLTGQAVSNVFDNSMELGGDVVCRGVQSQPAVGYLSQLEAMRYCEVGGYYKSPLFPVWVVGSTSHFTVLIGDAQCMVESSSDVLLEKCRRAFRAVDGGEDNGFIQVSSLGEVIRKLDLFETIGSDGLQTLQASLEVHGAGIILWSDFWKVASRLLTGAKLESVLQGDDSAGTKDQPLLLTQFGEGAAASSSSAATSAAAASSSASGAATGGDYMLSDEELARKLAAEWGTDPGQASSSTAAAAAAAQSTQSASSEVKSDEELARELQAQWNADPDMPPLEHVRNIVGDDIIAEVKPGEDPKPRSGEVNQAAEETREEAKMKPVTTGPEDVGNVFYLYHYNGLRGGTFTSFRVIRPKATDAVGSSITVSSHGGNASRDGGDLEDVVRTKWQQCQFNWLGKQPPYID